MMRIVQLLTLLSLATPSFAARPYEGPQECSDEDRVKRGDYIEIHYIGSIHEDSDTEGKGKVFDNSNDHGNTYNFQVGHGEVIKGCEYHAWSSILPSLAVIVYMIDSSNLISNCENDTYSGRKTHWNL